MENLQEQVDMNKVEELVRMGLMPVQNIPWLAQALRHMQGDAYLPLVERRVLYEFVRRIFGHVFNDPLIYRLIRQRTAMNKYEEFQPMDEATGPDFKKTPEGMLVSLATQAERKKRAGGKVSDADKQMASKAKTELRRRRDVATKKESYQAAFNQALSDYNISSIGELAETDIKDFLNKVDEIFNSNLGE